MCFNISKIYAVAILICCAGIGHATFLELFQGFNYSFGHIDVPQNASMFYWLFQTTANIKDYKMRPLVIWLENGPSNHVPENFNALLELIGPVDVNQQKLRNYTWIKYVNVLFVDCVIGSGYSYSESFADIPMSDKNITGSLLNFIKGFYKKHPEFNNVPVHVFGEGYYGKIAIKFANRVHAKLGNVKLKSVTIGNAWIAPKEYISSWADILHTLAYIDFQYYITLKFKTSQILSTIDDEYFFAASQILNTTVEDMIKETRGFNFYNIQQRTRQTEKINRIAILNNFMNGPIRKLLNISSNIQWNSNVPDITFFDDYLQPAIVYVENLLNNTNVKVNVYSGLRNVMVPAIATEAWINKMYWKDKRSYYMANRLPFGNSGYYEGYKKRSKNFAMYWINGAGNAAARENPSAMRYVLRDITYF